LSLTTACSFSSSRSWGSGASPNRTGSGDNHGKPAQSSGKHGKPAKKVAEAAPPAPPADPPKVAESTPPAPAADPPAVQPTEPPARDGRVDPPSRNGRDDVNPAAGTAGLGVSAKPTAATPGTAGASSKVAGPKGLSTAPVKPPTPTPAPGGKIAAPQ
jgi:hypothetical protein